MTKLERQLALSVVLGEKWTLENCRFLVRLATECMAKDFPDNDGKRSEAREHAAEGRLLVAMNAPATASALVALVKAVREGRGVHEAAEAGGKVLESLGVPASALGRNDVIGGK